MGEGLLFWAGFSVLDRSEENTSQPGTSSLAAGNITSQQSNKHLTRCFFDCWLVMAPAGLACKLWFLLIFYKEQFNPDHQKTLPIILANWLISQSNVGSIEIKIRMIKGSNQQYSKLNSLWKLDSNEILLQTITNMTKYNIGFYTFRSMPYGDAIWLNKW